jgi:regulatory protein
VYGCFNITQDSAHLEFAMSDDSQQTNKRKLRKARRYESVLNSAICRLGSRNQTEAELRRGLTAKTDNQEWIDLAIDHVKRYGYLKSDIEFVRLFAEQGFRSEYGSPRIIKVLKKHGIAESLIFSGIANVKQEMQITDEQTILNTRINSYYHEFTNISRESLIRILQNRGFSYAQVCAAIKQHPMAMTLKTTLELKAAKADLSKEITKYARKGKGLNSIRMELINRKIDISYLQVTVQRLVDNGDVDFYESCVSIMRKKGYDLDNRKERQKAYSYLYSKGFSSEEIKYAISEMTTSD